MRALILFLLLTSAALARDPDGRYANSSYAPWFKQQHNEQGQWCCDESDGHPYFGDYTLKENGSVVIHAEGGDRELPAYMVLKGTNPTGHAVWWYIETGGQHRDYCFAPGTLM